LAALEAFRERTFRRKSGLRVTTEEQALEFIRQAGFVFLLFPKEQLDFPSLSCAYPPRRKDWPWWNWKQTLPEKKACYYAKVLRRKGTFISWRFFPAFYAVYGGRDSYEQQWRAGLLDRTQKRLLEILERDGPLMTKELRLAYGPPGKENTRRVLHALEELQARFQVCPAGGDTEGWSHHNWDLVERWVPQKYLRQGRAMNLKAAGAALIAQFLRIVGASTLSEICWLFSWRKEKAQEFLAGVKELREVEIKNLGNDFLTLGPVLRELQKLR
jgi:hypothetical protein